MVKLGEISILRHDCYCLTIGMVDEVIIDTLCSYDSCPYCTMTFDPLKIGASCHSCQNQVTHTIPRYKLVLKMEQNGEKTKFHFWDATCIKNFGKTADQYCQEVVIRSRFSLPVLMNYCERLGLLGSSTMHDAQKGLQCVAEPWYQYLRDNVFSAGDEICFYFRPNKKVWEQVIRK
ncbi:hypothetical protein GmHk_06G017544 [Glycine max]|nr:hypothetical protein GmHk_06G017544 [Glycine max]KAH1247719.1 hypothetical protein GmHk_06G017544 [Glycine max]